jgi:hypothetical protein
MAKDVIIEGRADRAASALRDALSGLNIPKELRESYVEECRRDVARSLRAEKAARIRKRRKHEQTFDMFADRRLR